MRRSWRSLMSEDSGSSLVVNALSAHRGHSSACTCGHCHAGTARYGQSSVLLGGEVQAVKHSRAIADVARSSGKSGIVTVTALAARPEGDQTGGMTPPPDPHYRHRFPAEIISYAVWLYHVFSLSLRDVELILAERGVVVSLRDGATLVQEIRRKWMRCSSGSRACSTIFGAH
jgi:hypothetical protein